MEFSQFSNSFKIIGIGKKKPKQKTNCSELPIHCKNNQELY